MSIFIPINKLDVYRRMSEGQRVHVGQLAQNKQGVYFQYDAGYLQSYHNLSPFTLPFTTALSKAPARPHHGLHGVFADSLPDGWGLLLMDRIFRQQGIAPQQVTAMDRLAYIGGSGIGALSYEPVSEWKAENKEQWTPLDKLASAAEQVFDGESESILAALANAGGSGGARPKALIYIDPQQKERLSTRPHKNLQPWLIKFTSKNLPLGHEEGVCEAAYLTMAKQAGIDTPEWQLFTPPITSSMTSGTSGAKKSTQAKAWLAMKRFDIGSQGTDSRYHTQTLCGLLDADYRQPSLDYEESIKASAVLCKSPAVGQQQFTRALFNLFADNQDDHTKNSSFLMDDNGQWRLAPFYDVTFSPSPYHQHMMAYAGYGQQPTVKAIQALAKQANFAQWKEAQQEISKILEALSQWKNIARELQVDSKTIKIISKRLDEVYQENKGLLK